MMRLLGGVKSTRPLNHKQLEIRITKQKVDELYCSNI